MCFQLEPAKAVSMLLALSVVMGMLVQLAFSKFHSESNCSTRSLQCHTSIPFWHLLWPECSSSVQSQMLWNELSEWCKTRWRLMTKCQLCSQQRWPPPPKLRSDFRLHILVQLGHSCPWKIHPWWDFISWCKVVNQPSKTQTLHNAVRQHIKGNHLCYFVRQLASLTLGNFAVLDYPENSE